MATEKRDERAFAHTRHTLGLFGKIQPLLLDLQAWSQMRPCLQSGVP